MNITNLLLRHNYLPLPPDENAEADNNVLATVLMNLSYYGRGLDVAAFTHLCSLSNSTLVEWWAGVEKELKAITGEDRKIGDFVVYKNFPAEVLNKTEAEYWIPQLLMYWGFPNKFFTEPVKPREKMDQQPKCAVLKVQTKDTAKHILETYLCAPARWKETELQDVLFLSKVAPLNLGKLAFKENLVQVAKYLMANNLPINLTTATDVLRLAAGLSDGDVSLREKVKFKSFKKAMRRFILSTLENCSNLKEDFARRPEEWKRLVHQLHPGDYKHRFPKVVEAADALYNDKLTTFNSTVEGLLKDKNAEVLNLLSDRPGEFRRRLVHTVNLFSEDAVKAFLSSGAVHKLTTAQIVSLRSFLSSTNERVHRVFPPKGNWNKLQIGEPRPIEDRLRVQLWSALGEELSHRVPKVKVLDPATKLIKLPNNGGEIGPYTRGTAFPIPEEVEFIRTASYWKAGDKHRYNVWFDNGWNLFDYSWKSIGTCCWDAVNWNDAAIFSGDPTSSKEMEGRAAQMIDLYPSKLKKIGVSYAVWNILAYSRIPFSDVPEVYAALQWGKDPMKGNLFEPSRAQLSFPLTGKNYTKYICLLDLEKNEMVYLDANLRGSVGTATSNGKTLSEQMPAFMEYINALPSVYDLFAESIDQKGSETHILYTDQKVKLRGESAYVFKPLNETNEYKPLNINSLL